MLWAQLEGFTNMVCLRIKEDGMEISPSKCSCSASTPKLGKAIEEALAPGLKIPYSARNKSLGIGLGSGVVRNMRVVNKRLKNFRKRLQRYKQLRKCGVDTARIVRTGGCKALTYGQFASGTSPAMLLMQRRTVGRTTGPAAGAAGQNLNLAFMLADGSANGKAGPAYDAHLDPVVHWAQAVWYEWLPQSMLNRMVSDAGNRLARALRTWAVVTGPASALVATAGRLRWTAADALTLMTDTGKTLRLGLDPPAVVAKEVCGACPTMAVGSN